MINEWFIIANRFSNSGKTAGVIEKALKKLKDEKIKYSFNLTNNSIISTFVLTNQDFLPLSDNIFFLLSKEAFTGA